MAKKSASSRPSQHLSRAVGTAFDGHGADVWGLGLIVAGVVAALGIYGDIAGPVGSGFDWLAGGLVGVAKAAVPIALVVLGVVLVRGPARDEADDEATSGSASRSTPSSKARAASDRVDDHLVRVGVGAVIVAGAIAGLLHIGRGRPAWSEGADALSDAGGVLGYVLGAPLAATVETVAATVVLAALVVVGLLIITAGSLDIAFRSVASIGSSLRNAAIHGWQSTVGLPAEPTPPAPAVVVPTEEPPPAPDETAPVLEKPGKRPKVTLPPEPSGDAEQLAIDLGPAAKGSPWRLPAPTLLVHSDTHEVDEAMVAESGRVLERALEAHGVETRLVGMVVGPTVTRYELELGAGVKVARVTTLHKDIAYAMASPDVRILAPIPGRQAIGVEVPNKQRQVVALGDLLGSVEARRANHPLEVAIGRDISGRTMMMNLARMPHILIAGATGSGKSSCINSIITSILMRTTPEQVRMILVDPKMVEMTQYERVPHLLTQPVTDPKKAANALAWACREMDRRYELLSSVGFRDIDGYNAAFDRGEVEAALGEVDADGQAVSYKRLPMILVVVDELADLMMVAARDVEDSICRIAQKARAVGIHLVIATQRPSTNVITGIIKANIPARLAFAVSSLTDSRVILDQPGAERLVGQGDMLMVNASSSTAQRIQGAWVSEAEVRKVVAAWKRQKAEVDEVTGVEAESILEGPAGGDSTSGSVPGRGSDDDELLRQAMELVVSSQLGSTSMLQRKLRVGFARAGRLMDLLEERGVVGPSTGSKAREVLMTSEELGGSGESDESAA
ncbi:MAG: DNA translocase FtsK [Acidimicrobiia bacterium]|nr:DNA translocase FtsK [Acidimicrobiia bacterium]